MTIYRIRASKDVIQTSVGTRRRSFAVEGDLFTLDFGKEPIYLELPELPAEIDQDPHLLTKVMTEKEVAAAGGVITRLKPERVQDPAPAATSLRPPGEPDPPATPEAPAPPLPPAPVPPAAPPKPRKERAAGKK
jgi:hypothetical protein